MPPPSYREDDPTTYPPLSQLDSTLPIERRMIWPHLLVLSARIALYGTLAHRDEGLYERRLAAARDAVAILKQIQHDDANYHEVAMAVSALVEASLECCYRTDASFMFFCSPAGSTCPRHCCGISNACARLGSRSRLLQSSRKKPMRQHKRCDVFVTCLPPLVSLFHQNAIRIVDTNGFRLNS